ncbi:MAG: hypothetical protein J6K52_06660, partial [Clostridia bacterium]|nr:hypothetical protein [Clostridia bacterium]
IPFRECISNSYYVDFSTGLVPVFFVGYESSFELLLHDFVVNRVRKRGKSCCLLASIRLAEVHSL